MTASQMTNKFLVSRERSRSYENPQASHETNTCKCVPCSKRDIVLKVFLILYCCGTRFLLLIFQWASRSEAKN